jgi:hypothetical protein
MGMPMLRELLRQGVSVDLYLAGSVGAAEGRDGPGGELDVEAGEHRAHPPRKANTMP